MVRELDHPALVLGMVAAEGIEVAPSPAPLHEELTQLAEALRVEPARYPELVRGAVRDVLRAGGYKPTGRGKPASEYLLGQALSDSLPRISNLVDLCNLVSLRHAFPISVFDADLLGPEPSVRFGRPGESYVFNSSGQSMDIAGLPVICRGAAREPVGNAVKDSMACKVRPETSRALYVIYGSGRLPPALLEAALADLGRALRHHLHVSSTSALSLP